MNFYNVDIQSGTGFEFKNEFFTVTVEAEGFDEAAHRVMGRAVARAAEWNSEHPDADTLRLTVPQAYRAVGVRIEMAEFGDRVNTSAAGSSVSTATLLVGVDLPSILAALEARHQSRQ